MTGGLAAIGRDWQAYLAGMRAGWLDASLGRRLAAALTAPNPDYAAGYRVGQLDYHAGRPLTDWWH